MECLLSNESIKEKTEKEENEEKDVMKVIGEDKDVEVSSLCHTCRYE